MACKIPPLRKVSVLFPLLHLSEVKVMETQHRLNNCLMLMGQRWVVEVKRLIDVPARGDKPPSNLTWISGSIQVLRSHWKPIRGDKNLCWWSSHWVLVLVDYWHCPQKLIASRYKWAFWPVGKKECSDTILHFSFGSVLNRSPNSVLRTYGQFVRLTGGGANAKRRALKLGVPGSIKPRVVWGRASDVQICAKPNQAICSNLNRWTHLCCGFCTFICQSHIINFK